MDCIFFLNFFHFSEANKMFHVLIYKGLYLFFVTGHQDNFLQVGEEERRNGIS